MWYAVQSCTEKEINKWQKEAANTWRRIEQGKD
jgi:hypothetical protein